MARKEILENITSNEFLDEALQNAKKWCIKNLPKYLPKDCLKGLQDDPKYILKYLKRVFEGFDYNSLHYSIDNGDSVYDKTMCVQSKDLILVSTKKLEQLQEKEYNLKKHKKNFVEIDPESMFVNVITGAILIGREEINDAKTYVIENINRKERGLKLDRDGIKFLKIMHYPTQIYGVELVPNN